ncbi:hypothetical protein B5P45_12895 [Phyllobacterium zundukense]|uniref:Uncharacterized protein n=1 Tax=Phyllobacterium zundukense TaxID=1867719 RepID=A0A2N9VY83_9HYPH|nr:hypothetical protein BLM14_20105 [Phyllobacterium zundukense]PIO44451.1 hypothetical protein B5P45_12895 [Phyllobacterium zundukense]
MAADGATVGDMIDRGHSLWAHCYSRDCHHSSQIDLTELARRLGRDHAAMREDLVPKFRCSACGSKDVGITSTPY